MNKKQLIVAWVILFLLSSIAVAKQTTSPFELVKGVTTQKDVKENFGEPQTTRIESNGVVVWVFNKIKVEDLENSKKIPEAKEFILRFNKRGILIDYEIKMEKAETKDFFDFIVEAEIEDMRTGLQAWTDQKE
ncbi:MAG: hypothetical protein NC834_06210, partial [Candidatus Omnitrophica bacterium]|nr:hypothetical protein [Candidatus Omnitrophota bacterium]